MRIAAAGLLILLLALGCYAAARADIGASFGLCYGLSGSTVETTVVGSSYPIGMEVEVREVPHGIEVTHRATWPWERVYLAQVTNE